MVDQLDPELAGIAFNHEKGVKSYPSLALFSADFQSLYGRWSYRYKDESVELNSAMVKKLAKKARKMDEWETLTYDKAHPPMRVYDARSKGLRSSWKGTFVKTDTRGIHLRKPDGYVFLVSKEHFTAGTRKWYENRLRNPVEPGRTSPPNEEPTFATWTSNDGKEIVARCLAVTETEITLETENGKSYTLPLSRLDAASREQALLTD